MAEHENNAFLRDIRTAGAHDWIARSGLTAEECALIQPTYCFECDSRPEDPVCGSNGQTYSNACQAFNCAGVSVACQGPCPTNGKLDGGTTSDGGAYLCPRGDGDSGGCGISRSAAASLPLMGPAALGGLLVCIGLARRRRRT